MLLMFLLNDRSSRWWDYVVMETFCNHDWIQNFRISKETFLYLTGFRKTDPNCTFGILRITNVKYLTHCESLLLGCNHAIVAV